MAMVPFRVYKPDLDDLNGAHTQVLTNVLPRGDGWGPVRALQQYTGALSGGNDAFTRVLLSFDGADASTTITDSAAGASSSHSWTANGNAQIDTASYKFGGSALLCDGTGDYVASTDHADFALGAGD